ncbi:MAG TPA: glycosyltransferase family 4 protein [Blastocatellia bacterium]|nr:glycosyltransferase family 4 protein [Blastocatellia bacterium]
MKILWLKSDLLHPVDRGGKIRTYQMLKHLKRDHQITYLALTTSDDTREAFDRADEYCHKLITVPWKETAKFSPKFYCDLMMNLGSSLPYAIQKYRSPAMRGAIDRELSENQYDIVVSDFLVPSINLPQSHVPSVLFQHNVESMIWQRHYETANNKAKKGYFYGQWRKMVRYEREACRRFDCVIAVSDVDRELFRNQFKLAEVHDVPTGVDTAFFQPMTASKDPFGLVFTGSMDWLPNEDAIVYFAEQILPQIAAEIPQVNLTVVGRKPTSRLKALAETNPRIKVTGRVEDIRPFMAAASAYVVPMRIGGGTRIKIYEAMSMAMPLISTSVGAEGLPLRNTEEVLIEDEPSAFAQAVIRILKDKEFARRIGEKARQVVCERFGWQHAANKFAEICQRVAKKQVQALAA